jgi:hypothetical protein
LTTAFGSVVVEMTRGAATTIVRDCVFTWGGLAESVVCAVKGYEPAVAGVPEMDAPKSVSPEGSEPALIVQVTAPVPPIEASDWV